MTAQFNTETTNPLLGAASFTGIMGASFTATGTGTSLVVTLVTGTIAPGDTVNVTTGIPANTTIVSQSSGTPGGAGTYVTNQATTIAAAAATSKSNILHASALTGVLFVGQIISGSGLTGNPAIVSQASGTLGAAGNYILSAQFQVVSEAMTGSAEIFIGEAHEFDATNSGFSTLRATAVADQSGNLYVDISLDGETWVQAGTAAMTANTLASVELPVMWPYYRVREANGSTAQGSNTVQFGAR